MEAKQVWVTSGLGSVTNWEPHVHCVGFHDGRLGEWGQDINVRKQTENELIIGKFPFKDKEPRGLFHISKIRFSKMQRTEHVYFAQETWIRDLIYIATL